MEECGPCPAFASFTLAFALQLGKKHVKNLSQSTVYILPKHPHITKTRAHTHAEESRCRYYCKKEYERLVEEAQNVRKQK
jgi:hypothetical protein